MSRVCYGQNFEDVILWRALGHIRHGRYLDIGAQHPVIDSVSRSFYLEGWRGIHVEPSPQYAEALRADRADEEVIEAAAGDRPGPLQIHIFADTGLSTAVGDIAKEHHQAGLHSTEIEVPVVTLEELLNRFSGEELHWLKIDVEGMEASVLRSWGASEVRPWVLIIESTFPGTQLPNDSAWRDLVEDRGYHEVLFDGLSRFFLADEHSDIDQAFEFQANCFDDFRVPWHHWSAANIVASHRGEIAGIEARAAEFERERNERDLRLSELRDERALLSVAISSLTVEAESARRVVADLQKHEEELLALSRSLSAQLSEANHRNAQVETSRRESDLALALATNELLEAKAELKYLVGQHEAARSQIQRMRDEIAELAHQISSLHDQLLIDQNIISLARSRMVPWPARILCAFSAKWRKNGRGLRRAIENWSPSFPGSSQPTSKETEGSVMDLFHFDRRNPYLRADSISELCSFADINFVRCAFVTMLGRQPDEQGEIFYLLKLRSGISKLSIIFDLRNSAEGKSHDPGIAGLDRILRKHHNANRPIIGWLIRLLAGREGNGVVERKLRILENSLEFERNLAGARFAHMNHYLVIFDGKIDHLQKQIHLRSSDAISTVRQIANTQAASDPMWEASLNSALNG